MNDDIGWIAKHYGVPAVEGGRVLFEGKPGTIVGSSGPHLMVRLDGERKASPYHPTWHIEYVEDKS